MKVQCCHEDCSKWRYLKDILDPLEVPAQWYCTMNTDIKYNICSIGQCPYFSHEDLIDNSYTAGSLVWAKMAGYPWWPAMVDDDPEYLQYYILSIDSNRPKSYHVTFFDSNEVTRSWINFENLKKYDETNPRTVFKKREGPQYKFRLMKSVMEANKALTLPIRDRLSQYSFVMRYKGPLIYYKPLSDYSDDDRSTICFSMSPEYPMSEDDMLSTSSGHTNSIHPSILSSNQSNTLLSHQNPFQSSQNIPQNSSTIDLSNKDNSNGGIQVGSDFSTNHTEQTVDNFKNNLHHRNTDESEHLSEKLNEILYNRCNNSKNSFISMNNLQQIPDNHSAQITSSIDDPCNANITMLYPSHQNQQDIMSVPQPVHNISTESVANKNNMPDNTYENCHVQSETSEFDTSKSILETSGFVSLQYDTNNDSIEINKSVCNDMEKYDGQFEKDTHGKDLNDVSMAVEDDSVNGIDNEIVDHLISNHTSTFSCKSVNINNISNNNFSKHPSREIFSNNYLNNGLSKSEVMESPPTKQLKENISYNGNDSICTDAMDTSMTCYREKDVTLSQNSNILTQSNTQQSNNSSPFHYD